LLLGKLNRDLSVGDGIGTGYGIRTLLRVIIADYQEGEVEEALAGFSFLVYGRIRHVAVYAYLLHWDFCQLRLAYTLSRIVEPYAIATSFRRY